MAKYSKVVKGECIACGICASVASDIFEEDDAGYAENIYAGDGNSGVAEIPEELHDELLDAAQSCPTEAIKVSEEPFA